MAEQYFDRYSRFRVNGETVPLPMIKLPKSSNDLVVIYKQGRDRLDIISQKYYNTPYYGFLILLANPQYGGLEFNIKSNDKIRVPYPLTSALERYSNEVSIYKILYG
jgi:hypothetical protein